ncbi:MFS transporter [Streptomyces sp. TR1341]|uniref:MFS transporter n=1 Tax=Streptomyces sp. TR1341 TaxID=2601266 RepID=UPI00138AEA10|nr:MFS transporter [Streptomyces sp. TR1341]
MTTSAVPEREAGGGAPDVPRPSGRRSRRPGPRGWRPWHTVWFLLLLGWAVGYMDRALTGPVITWMIDHRVAFMADAAHPFALGGLVGGLFFTGYMLNQFQSGYLGDRFGPRTLLVISVLWAGAATLFTGLAGGLFAFVVLRVVTGLGEGAYHANDRNLVVQVSPPGRLGTGMGVVICGASVGLVLATVGTPWLLEHGGGRFSGDQVWRLPFLIMGVLTLGVGIAFALGFRRHLRLRVIGRAALLLAAPSAVALVAIMGLYEIADRLAVPDLWTAVIEVALACVLVGFLVWPRRAQVGPLLRDRNLLLLDAGILSMQWNLWFFSFWAVSIVAGAAHTGLLQAALVAALNGGAGLLGYPLGGYLTDEGVRRGWGRKPPLLVCLAAQAVLTFAFAWYVADGGRSLWTMAVLLFAAGLFFNAGQPFQQALNADIAPPELRGTQYGLWNTVGETAAVLSPAVNGVLRDATGNWTAALLLDGVIVTASLVVLAWVREPHRGRTPSRPNALKGISR